MKAIVEKMKKSSSQNLSKDLIKHLWKNPWRTITINKNNKMLPTISSTVDLLIP